MILILISSSPIYGVEEFFNLLFSGVHAVIVKNPTKTEKALTFNKYLLNCSVLDCGVDQ